MNNPFDSQELFGIYAAEVGIYLPRRKRKDIELEILSLLEDALEDKSDTAEQPADEKLALEVLKEFGPPITFASSYRTNQVLVGPEIFPLFRPVLQLAAIIYLTQFLIGVVITLTHSPFDILNTVDAFFDKGFQIFGILVFAFALLERTTPKTWLYWPFKDMENTWDPAGLMPENAKKRIKPTKYWFESLVMLGFAVLFIVFPHWVGFGNNTNGVWSFIPVLSKNYLRFAPWIGAFFLSRFIFAVMLARQGHWDNKMHWFEIGLTAYGILLLIALLYGPDIVGINQTFLSMHTYNPDLLAWFKATLQYWNTGLRIYLLLMVIIQSIVLVIRTIRMVLNRGALKFPLPTKKI
ncbi:MAG TPA: hypothetical protein VJ965_10220 [Anaerolineales bacterium]|nr:hypothetical protein [Anaerolineales bacterium]